MDPADLLDALGRVGRRVGARAEAGHKVDEVLVGRLARLLADHVQPDKLEPVAEARQLALPSGPRPRAAVSARAARRQPAPRGAQEYFERAERQSALSLCVESTMYAGRRYAYAEYLPASISVRTDSVRTLRYGGAMRAPACSSSAGEAPAATPSPRGKARSTPRTSFQSSNRTVPLQHSQARGFATVWWRNFESENGLALAHGLIHSARPGVRRHCH